MTEWDIFVIGAGRAAFWLEAAAMTPFALFCLLAPPIDICGPKEGADFACFIRLLTSRHTKLLRPAVQLHLHSGCIRCRLSARVPDTAFCCCAASAAALRPICSSAAASPSVHQHRCEYGGSFNDLRSPGAEERASKSSGAGGTLRSPVKQLGHDLKQLWRHPVYTTTVGGTAVYTGADTGLPSRNNLRALIVGRALALRQSKRPKQASTLAAAANLAVARSAVSKSMV